MPTIKGSEVGKEAEFVLGRSTQYYCSISRSFTKYSVKIICKVGKKNKNAMKQRLISMLALHTKASGPNANDSEVSYLRTFGRKRRGDIPKHLRDTTFIH